MTTQTDLQAFILPPAASHARAQGRARARQGARHTPALCAAMLCAGSLWADATQARPPRAPRAASTPSTAQILAPSAATVPDALPPDRLIYRCGDSYSPHACVDAKPLDVDDPRTASQRLQAEDVATRDQRLASWLEAGRREREGAASEPKNGRSRANKGCIASATLACDVRKPKVRRAKVITPAKSTPGGAR